MKKIFLLMATIIMLYSCSNNISNKPIYEELTIDEVEKAMKQDSNFGFFYDRIAKAKYDLKMSPSAKAKYKDVTYRRYFAYKEYKDDFWSWVEKDSIWIAEWTQKYAKAINATDSVINYWREYKIKCNAEIDKYVKARITDVGIFSDRQYNWDTHREEYVSRRTYDVTYSLSIPKIDKVNYEVTWRNKYGTSDGWPITASDKNITQKDSVKKSYCAGLSDRKPTDIWITSIEFGGKVIKTKYNKRDVPAYVRDYLLNEKESDWNEIGRRYSGVDFMSKSEYLKQQEENDLRKFDELCFEFDQEF